MSLALLEKNDSRFELSVNNEIHHRARSAMNITIEKGNSTQALMTACRLFLTNPDYADHRKLTLAILAVLILIGMLFIG